MANEEDAPATPARMSEAAQALAASLLSLPEAEKDSELRRLKQENPALHALTVRALQTMMDRLKRPPEGRGEVH